MKKSLLILCFVLCSGIVSADAQIIRGSSSIRTVERNRKSRTLDSKRYPCYQGEINVGYGMGGDSLSRFTFETVNGVRINRYLFAGVGVGVSYFTEEYVVMMPVSAALRGYYPVTKRFAPYVSLDLGYTVNPTGDNDYPGGFYMAYGIGFNYGKLNFALGFQRFSYTGYDEIWNGSYTESVENTSHPHTFQVKIGVKF